MPVTSTVPRPVDPAAIRAEFPILSQQVHLGADWKAEQKVYSKEYNQWLYSFLHRVQENGGRRAEWVEVLAFQPTRHRRTMRPAICL